MFASVTAAETENIGPFFDSVNLYGASNQLSSRLIPQTSLSTPTSIQKVAEAIWTGSQILNEPLLSGPSGTFGAVPPFLLGNMPAATRQKANETGANPGLYEAAWHVVYAMCVVNMLRRQDWINEFFRPWTIDANETTNDAIVEAIHGATDPLAALGIASSYQNEGDAFEVNWQQGQFSLASIFPF
jgi:hypothetical protein